MMNLNLIIIKYKLAVGNQSKLKMLPNLFTRFLFLNACHLLYNKLRLMLKLTDHKIKRWHLILFSLFSHAYLK